MDTSNVYSKEEYQTQKGLADEYGSWPIDEEKVKHVAKVKWAFDELQGKIAAHIPPNNARYLALVKTKLEEACMFAVKGISKP